MRIQPRMICQPSCKISAVKFRRVREGKGGKEERRKGGEGRQKKKIKGETKVTLKLFNFRYHRNCFQNFSN